MFPYILLIVLAFLCATTDVFKTKNRIVLLLPFFIYMFMIVAFRNRLGGTDYTMYEMFYTRVVPIQDYLRGLYEPFYRTKSFEEGFVIFSSVVKSFDFTNGPFLLMFVVALVNFCIFYPSLKEYTPYVMIAIFFFMYKAFFWHQFTLLRQSVAISLFAFSIRYIYRKEYLKYIILNAVGVSFHATALILLPLCFLVNRRLSIRTILLLLVVALLISILSPILWKLCMMIASAVGIGDRLMEYSQSVGGINSLNLIEILAILFIALFYRKKFEQEEPYFNIFLNLFLTSSLLIISFSSFYVFARFKEYFVVSYMVLISYFIGHLKRDRDRWSAFLILSAYIGLGYFRYLFVFDEGGLLPYKWILW